MALHELKCEPCHARTDPMGAEEARALALQVPEWTLSESMLTREFKFPSFREAVKFVDRVAEVAESEDHHPDIHLSYRRVRLELTTHRIGGLSPNDFVVAAKIDRLLPP